MRLSALQYSAAGKAVWGRAVLIALLAMLLLPAATADAAGSPPPGKGTTLTAKQQAAQDARVARRHAKLDLQLNDAVEDAANAESNVIIEFYDETGAVNLV